MTLERGWLKKAFARVRRERENDPYRRYVRLTRHLVEAYDFPCGCDDCEEAYAVLKEIDRDEVERPGRPRILRRHSGAPLPQAPPP